MTDYSKGKVYMITTNHNCKIYIGSTVKTLEERLRDHKIRYDSYQKDNTRKFLSSFELLDYDDYKIELIENFPCKSLNELSDREGYHMKLNRPFIVNKHILTRTQQEWRDEHKVFKHDYNTEYYKKNHTEIKEQYTKYRNENREHIRELAKQAILKNPEKYKKTKDEWEEKNKEKRRAQAYRRRSAMRKCDSCDIEVKIFSYSAHLKTKLHLSNI